MSEKLDVGALSAHFLASAKLKPSIRTAVVHPCSDDALQGAMQAAQLGLITPVLVGPLQKITAIAKETGLDLSACEIIDAPHSHAAAEKSVALARSGHVEALMKGSLHTDELMSEVVRSDTGLRTERRISHVFFMAVQSYHKPFIITDAAMNIAPDLLTKRDILQNAIDVWRGIHDHNSMTPKVAILAAVEMVNPAMQSTIDAAALCKMSDRGQIRGAIIDGPLAYDNAISAEAARIKNITSPVSGDPDILLVPDLEAGNMLVKQLTLLAKASSAGVILGARVPIILTSRSDNVDARIASCALAVLIADAQRNDLLSYRKVSNE